MKYKVVWSVPPQLVELQEIAVRDVKEVGAYNDDTKHAKMLSQRFKALQRLSRWRELRHIRKIKELYMKAREQNGYIGEDIEGDS